MKIASLDIGDRWTGSALSDAMGIIAKPYKTVETAELAGLIEDFIKNHRIATIIIGYPRTMKGGESEQTKKVLEEKKRLEEAFSGISFVLWDERLSSKRAIETKPPKNKEEKLQEHSKAAAFILDSYLNSPFNNSSNR